ncbi:MAG: hypothetical protein K1W41_27920, partial [Lachnospiraceae bacterium]
KENLTKKYRLYRACKNFSFIQLSNYRLYARKHDEHDKQHAINGFYFFHLFPHLPFILSGFVVPCYYSKFTKSCKAQYIIDFIR